MSETQIFLDLEFYNYRDRSNTEHKLCKAFVFHSQESVGEAEFWTKLAVYEEYNFVITIFPSIVCKKICRDPTSFRLIDIKSRCLDKSKRNDLSVLVPEIGFLPYIGKCCLILQINNYSAISVQTAATALATSPVSGWWRTCWSSTPRTRTSPQLSDIQGRHSHKKPSVT